MRRRPIAIAVVVALVATGIALRIRKKSIEAAERARRVLDIEIATYYQRTVKPALATNAEPDHITGRVLPIYPFTDDNLDMADPDDPVWIGTCLYTSVYDQLDSKIRADRLANANTLAIIDSDTSTLYGGRGAIPRSVASRVTITLFDPTTKRAIGRTQIEQESPPEQATRDDLDAYSNRMTARIAAYLDALPRR